MPPPLMASKDLALPGVAFSGRERHTAWKNQHTPNAVKLYLMLPGLSDRISAAEGLRQR